METCVRGFSYMPQMKLDPMQYIQTGELERTWRASRRQRLKEQEQRIWEEFVKEQDVVKKACKEDPYQFLHQLPENCLKELMEPELNDTTGETQEEIIIVEPLNQGEGDHPTEKPLLHSVTFAEERDKSPTNGDIFHIFDDEFTLSGADDEVIETPSTVRMRGDHSASVSPRDNVKPVENVSSMIENSIYCAKVKDLRIKLNAEVVAIMASLDIQDVVSAEREEISRRCRRSAEFCARFNRIYMYQLKRQMHDIERHQSLSLPFAQHTQFQSQMLRVVSLHHNLLQSLQVFHKSFRQTSCLRESLSVLRAVSALVRDVTALCRSVPAPKDLAATNLYNDELCQTCDKLDEALNDYKLRVADFLSSSEIGTVGHSSSSPSSRHKGRGKQKKGRIALSKLGLKSCSNTDTDARLSMYSIDTQRTNPRGARLSHSGPPRSSAPGSDSRSRDKSLDKPRNHKSANPRRPLMRAPRDADIRTMVEGVVACPSSHVSAAASPASPRRRAAHGATPRTSQKSTPRSKLGYTVPRTKNRVTSPNKPAPLKRPLTNIESEATSITTNMKPMPTPVTKIQCAVKSPDSNRNIGKNIPGDHPGKTDDEPKDCHTNEGKDMFQKISKDVFHEDSKDTFHKDGRQHGHIGNPGKEDGYTGKECSGMDKTLMECSVETDFASSQCKKNSEGDRDSERTDKKSRGQNKVPARCEVSRLLQQLCSGDPTGSRNEKVSGAKNAQLYCINSGSPTWQPSTPQLLRILEETIQKKTPKPMYSKPRDPDRFRLTFNIAEQTANRMFSYRTKFVQHMLTSPMYANSAVGKPWEMIGSASEQIIDEVLAKFAEEMEIKEVLQELYKCETN